MHRPLNRSRPIMPRRVQPFARVSLFAFLLLASLLATGCNAQTTPASQPTRAAETPATATPQTPASAPAASSYLDRFSGALEQAGVAKDAIAQRLGDASQTGSDTAAESVEWATQMFNSLKEQGLTSATDTRQWLANDWSRAGAWEYKTLRLADGTAIETKLNEVGEDRWECFHVDHRANGTLTFYLKRPVHSYLDNLPMKDAMHLLPIIGAGKAADR